MKVIDPGHVYELPNAVYPGKCQTLSFLKKEPINEDSDQLALVADGTTNEEVLKVLIDRLQSGNAKVPSRETAIAITKIQEALMWLDQRTKDRIVRGVEGTQNK